MKNDEIEKIPLEIRKGMCPISRNALQAYSKNLYANKFGKSSVKTVATPIMFWKRRVVGAWIYEKMDKVCDKMLDWFVAPLG